MNMKVPPLQTYRWTRRKFERVVREGGFDRDDRIELLDGQLVVREPQGDLHAAAVAAIQTVLGRAFGAGYHVRVGSPVALDDGSEPEPDLAVVSGDPWDYRAGHPTTPVLVVEVSDSSLAKDRLRKGPLYARAGIADYWIVNLIDEVLEVYRAPTRTASRRSGWKYEHISLLKKHAVISPLAKPDARIRVATLLP